jgi:hypothetical protein
VTALRRAPRTVAAPGPSHRKSPPVPRRPRITTASLCAAPRTVAPRPVLLTVLALVLVACGGGNQPSSVDWRNVTVRLPEGWYVLEEEDTRLSISNQDVPEATQGGVPDVEGPVVGMFFTYEPNTIPDDWRRFVEQQDATLESDSSLTLDGEVPATRLIFSYETLGIPLREMVAVIPSRGIVVLAQPIPGPGDTTAPETFLDFVETFNAVLEGLEFGPPLMD